MQIGSRFIGFQRPPYVIAEIGSNHAQDKSRMYELITSAAEAGADAVKFQTFEPEELVAPDVRLPNGMLYRDAVAKSGLPRAWHKEAKTCAAGEGVDFLSTPFSVDAARFLVEDIGVPALKIASGDLTYKPLLEYAGSLNRDTPGLMPILLSTGAAEMSDIEEALGCFPMKANQFVVLLHCVSSYPCHAFKANLRSLSVLHERYPSLILGWSDHTLSTSVVPSLAYTLGAAVIEKHFTLDRSASTPDAQHSLEPREFRDMMNSLQAASLALGVHVKRVSPEEEHDRLWARRDSSDWLRPVVEVRSHIEDK